MSSDQQGPSAWQQVTSLVGRKLSEAWKDLKTFFKEAPAAFLLVAGLVVTIYVAYQPATLIDRGWSRFEVFQRSVLWLVRGTAFRSIVGPVALLVSYGALYYGLRVRGRRFIVVSDFRVWGELEKTIHAKGVAGRLQDELMHLLAEMGASESGLPAERTRATGAPSDDSDSPEAKPALLPGGLSLPETQVTLQYEGFSLEGLHTFIRRSTGREVVVTGDLFNHPNGVLLVARTRDKGPWEVLIEGTDTASLGLGLRRLSLRIMTTLAQGFLPTEANIFVFLEIKAEELEEYDLLLRLAWLASDAASDKDETGAQENLAAAYYKRGCWHLRKGRSGQARLDFKEAIEWWPRDFAEAWDKLEEANQKLGLTEDAESAKRQAKDIRSKMDPREGSAEQPAGPSNERTKNPGAPNG